MFEHLQTSSINILSNSTFVEQHSKMKLLANPNTLLWRLGDRTQWARLSSVAFSVIGWATKVGGRHVGVNWNVDSRRFVGPTFFVGRHVGVCERPRRKAFIFSHRFVGTTCRSDRPTCRWHVGPTCRCDKSVCLIGPLVCCRSNT